MAAGTELLSKLVRARQIECVLTDAIKVTLLRPDAAEVRRMTKPHPTEEGMVTVSVEPEDVVNSVIGWTGVSEASILGASVGSADPIEFDKLLWKELVRDDEAWMMKVTTSILEAIIAHRKKKADVEKNSVPA